MYISDIRTIDPQKQFPILKTVEGVINTTDYPFCSRPPAFPPIFIISVTGFFLYKTELYKKELPIFTF